MSTSLKKYDKHFSLHHYIAVLKRQPTHMKHVYAALFAGAVTVILALIILYVDYGLWNERYAKGEEMHEPSVNESVVDVRSPKDMVGSFFQEAKEKLKDVNTNGALLLDGKDVYIRE